MYEKELFDETLDINSTNNYEISIQLSLNGFSFSLLDSLRNRFVMFREYALSGNEISLSREIRNLIEKDEFLSKPYRRHRLVFSFERSTIIPGSLYDPAIKDEYFSLNHSLEKDYIISNNKLTQPDAYIIFDIRKDIFNLCCEIFPEASLSHQVKPLLHSAFNTARKSRGRYIQIHIEDSYFSLFIINNDKLEFFNSFRFRNNSDILYYLLNIFNQFDITNNEALWLSGNIFKFDDLYNSLLKYIKTLKFCEPSGSFSLSYIFNEIGTHRYCNLFNIVNCG